MRAATANAKFECDSFLYPSPILLLFSSSSAYPSQLGAFRLSQLGDFRLSFSARRPPYASFGSAFPVQAEWASYFEKSQIIGAFTWKLDGALPQRHTLRLYNSLIAQESAILIQLRTDHNQLQKYLYWRKLAESDQCKCGQNKDSTRHLLLECPKWKAQRQMLRPKVGVRWGDLLYMLGGWNSWKDRRGGSLDGPKED